MSLASLLKKLIDESENEDRSRPDIVSSMARESGIDESTVGQIVRGEISCPPLLRLRGFAKALDVPAKDLIEQAESDGCTYNSQNSVVRFQAASAGLISREATDQELNQTPDQISIEALIFYSGNHKNGGQTLKFSKEKIQEMVDLSNQRQRTRRIKLFLDHGGNDGMVYDQRTSIGFIEGPLTTREIQSPSDLPFPDLFDQLQGELGIYATVTLTGEENVQNYRTGQLQRTQHWPRYHWRIF